MKKTIWAVIILALCCVFALSGCDKGTKNPSEGLEYTLDPDSDSYSVSGVGTCTDTDVVIPSAYNGKPVTRIAGYAFYECTDLTSITIPDSVTEIGWAAFHNTAYYDDADNWVDGALYIGNYLIEAQLNTLPANYTIKLGTRCIADSAFSNCTGLMSITIPDSVTSIGEAAFDGCTGLTSITIPNSVTSIGSRAFKYCSSLTSITIPDSVIRIGRSAFENTAYYGNDDNWVDGVLYINNHLIDAQDDDLPAKYTIKIGTKYIADWAFSGCDGLTSITLPDSVTSVGNYAFPGCTGLTSITVDAGNTVYHSAGNCLIETATKTLVAGCRNSAIPTDGSVTNIGDSAFYGCTGLTSITIPDSVTSIGYYAFNSCTGLTSITIPSSVTCIGNIAFSWCEGLTSITFEGTKAQWNAISKGNDWDLNTSAYTVHCTDGDIVKE